MVADDFELLCFMYVFTIMYLRVVFFFNDTATPEIYTLSLHDALPISVDVEPEPLARAQVGERHEVVGGAGVHRPRGADQDRKSTRLNSSHPSISYAVFCLKKKI